MKLNIFIPTIIFFMTSLIFYGCNNYPGMLTEEYIVHMDEDYPMYTEITSELLSKLNIQKPTGKWFWPGPIGYGIGPSGTCMPGEKIRLSTHTAEREKVKGKEFTFRFKLVKGEQDWEYIETIQEEIIQVDEIIPPMVIYETNLPKEEGVYYFFSAEVLDSEGNVEDTLYIDIFVPIQEMNALLTLNKEFYRRSDTLILEIHNQGPTNLSLGRLFTVERFEKDSWHDYPLDIVFTMENIGLAPGWRFEQSIPLAPFKRGEYKISKKVGAVGTDIEEVLTATFAVR